MTSVSDKPFSLILTEPVKHSLRLSAKSLRKWKFKQATTHTPLSKEKASRAVLSQLDSCSFPHSVRCPAGAGISLSLGIVW